MSQYVLYYNGEDESPNHEIIPTLEAKEIQILDTLPQMILVEGSEIQLKEIVHELDDWNVSPLSYGSVPPDPTASVGEDNEFQPAQQPVELEG